jgi:hypothetical protein
MSLLDDVGKMSAEVHHASNVIARARVVTQSLPFRDLVVVITDPWLRKLMLEP